MTNRRSWLLAFFLIGGAWGLFGVRSVSSASAQDYTSRLDMYEIAVSDGRFQDAIDYLLEYSLANCAGGLELWERDRASIRQWSLTWQREEGLFGFYIHDVGFLNRFSECSARTSSVNLNAILDSALTLGKQLHRSYTDLNHFAVIKASILYNAGRIADAIQVLSEIEELLPESPSVEDAETELLRLHALVTYQLELGDVSSARTLSATAKNVAARTKNNVLVAETLMLEAHVLSSVGDHAGARRQLEEVEELLIEAGREGVEDDLQDVVSYEATLKQRIDLLLFRLYGNLGTALIYIGEYRLADRRFTELLRMIKESSLPEYSIRIWKHNAYNWLSLLRKVQGDSLGFRRYEKLASDLTNTVEQPVAGPSSSAAKVASVSIELASGDAGRMARGWAASDSLLQEFEQRADTLLSAALRVSRAEHLLRYGRSDSDRQRAETEARLAVEILEATGHETLRAQGYYLLASAQTDLKERAKLLRTSAEMAAGEWGLGIGQLLNSLYSWAHTEAQLGRYAQADTAYASAIAAAEMLRLKLSDEDYRSYLAEQDLINRIYSEAAFFYSTKVNYWRGLVAAELLKSRGLSDQLLARHVADALPVVQDEASDSSAYADETLQHKVESALVRIRHQQQAALSQRTADSAQVAQYLATVGRATSDTFGVRRLGHLDAALLSYLTYENYILSWFVGGDSISFVVDTISHRRLSKLVDQVTMPRSRLAFGRATTTLLRQQELATQELYRLLVKPWETHLRKAGKSRLVIVPHAQLSRVPFAALAPKDAAALGERFGVAVLPAMHLYGYVAEEESPRAATSFLGIVDPGGTLTRAEDEVTTAAQHFENQTILGGPSATEEAVRRVWADADVLHFATHAVADDSVANAGYIRLAPDHEGDGRLSVEEVLSSTALKAQLVVLSACSTGAGKTLTGEGVMGFGRAFLAAGANALLVTLWPVEDEVASYFTNAFYDAWRSDGLRLPEAYRTALVATRAVYPSMNDWAAFQLIANDW